MNDVLPDVYGAPSSMNTLLDELIMFEALPIWNKTVPLGDPALSSLVADRLCVEEGQNQPPQVGRVLLIDLASKNNPFDPLSIKLLL